MLIVFDKADGSVVSVNSYRFENEEQVSTFAIDSLEISSIDPSTDILRIYDFDTMKTVWDAQDNGDGIKVIDGQVQITMNLDRAKQQKKVGLLALRDAEIFSNLTSTTTGYTYECSDYAQIKMQKEATRLLLNTSKTTVDWWTLEAGKVTHTKDQFSGLLDELGDREEAGHEKYWQLEAQVDPCTTQAEIDAIAW